MFPTFFRLTAPTRCFNVSPLPIVVGLPYTGSDTTLVRHAHPRYGEHFFVLLKRVKVGQTTALLRMVLNLGFHGYGFSVKVARIIYFVVPPEVVSSGAAVNACLKLRFFGLAWRRKAIIINVFFRAIV
jgi:hypothetical protein